MIMHMSPGAVAAALWRPVNARLPCHPPDKQGTEPTKKLPNSVNDHQISGPKSVLNKKMTEKKQGIDLSFSGWGIVKAIVVGSSFLCFTSMGGSVVSAAVSVDNFIEQNNVDDNAGVGVANFLEEKNLRGLEDASPENATSTAPTDPNDASSESLDCPAIQKLSKTDPALVEGSTMAIIKDKCDQGIISTADEVTKALKDWEGPNPNLDNQIANMATDICEKVSTIDEQSSTEIKEACGEDPRDHEHVVDVAAKLQAQHSPPPEGSINMAELCASLNENRTEIEAGLAILESRSNERRLDGSATTKVSSFGLASDTIVMLECYCDENNPDNEGCTKKQLKFAESTATSVIEEGEKDLTDDPAKVLSELESSLEKHTNNLRTNLSTKSENDVQTSVERAMSEVGVGKCNPPGVTQTNTGGYKICLYAGPYFECEVAWDPYEAACVESSCGGGNIVKLVAATKFCAHPSATLEMELKLCVDVVSDILNVIGRHIPAFEKIMNSFGIYGGCYRLAWAKYNMRYNRFEVTVGPHKKWFLNANIYVGAKAFMRFGSGCIYSDDLSWATYDAIAKENNPGKINNYWHKWIMAHIIHGLWSIIQKDCKMRVKPYALFEITFGLEMHFVFFTKDIWSTAAHFLVGGGAAGDTQANSLNHNNFEKEVGEGDKDEGQDDIEGNEDGEEKTTANMDSSVPDAVADTDVE